MNFIERVKAEYPGIDVLKRPQLWAVATKHNFKKDYYAFINNPKNKMARGLYKVGDSGNLTTIPPNTTNKVAPIKPRTKKVAMTVTAIDQPVETKVSIADLNCIPEKDKNFVPFGDFSIIKQIISTGQFFPVYISGESGNGKTKMVYQACAINKRELIRANITESTDEDDLIGGYRLVNGETVFQDGPVIEAMKRGAVLLLDEINLGTAKIMCLQPVLEGNPIYIKKTNTLITPKPGFNVIATANTKGNSSEEGRYIGSNILNEALLDRFSINIEHDYPTEAIEERILTNILTKYEAATEENQNFVQNLVKWSKTIRDTFRVGGIDDIISTRRLISIVQFSLMTGSLRLDAIKYCISRFNTDTQKAFLSLYQKIDSAVPVGPEVEKSASAKVEYEDDNLF